MFPFDEADRYLPAVGRPATTGPRESLRRRARSAGVGVFLTTQSPGDLDYKCRDQVTTWLVGRVKEAVAVAKLRRCWRRSRGRRTGWRSHPEYRILAVARPGGRAGG